MKNIALAALVALCSVSAIAAEKTHEETTTVTTEEPATMPEMEKEVK